MKAIKKWLKIAIFKKFQCFYVNEIWLRERTSDLGMNSYKERKF